MLSKIIKLLFLLTLLTHKFYGFDKKEFFLVNRIMPNRTKNKIKRNIAEDNVIKDIKNLYKKKK